MAKEIKMPQLSDTMYSGKIIAWRKKEGDPVKRGDVLAEVETDKANLEIECFDQGTLLKIMVPTDTEAKVGQVIAVIGQTGEAVGTTSNSPASSPTPSSSNIQTQAQPTPVSTPEPTKPNPPTSALQHQVSGDRVKASPLAKKLAADRQIDLTTIRGTGPDGRIIKKDLETITSTSPSAASHTTESNQQTAQVLEYPKQEEAETQSARGGAVSTGAGKLTELTKMRATIARRMQESVREAPHFYLMSSIDMTAANQLRERLKEEGESFTGISVNHLVIKAVGYALHKEPTVNNSVKDGKLFEPAEINVGIITATKDGLLIPVVRNVDKLSLKDLVFEARAAVERARVGRPSQTDLLGGTFSISNLGMFGIEKFTAIINPGQGGILAVGGILEQPVAKNGQVVVAPIMQVTLSVDHRIIDGVMGAKFLRAFKEALEMPGIMLCQ